MTPLVRAKIASLQVAATFNDIPGFLSYLVSYTPGNAPKVPLFRLIQRSLNDNLVKCPAQDPAGFGRLSVLFTAILVCCFKLR